MGGAEGEGKQLSPNPAPCREHAGSKKCDFRLSFFYIFFWSPLYGKDYQTPPAKRKGDQKIMRGANLAKMGEQKSSLGGSKNNAASKYFFATGEHPAAFMANADEQK